MAFQIVRDDITKVKADAVVNPAGLEAGAGRGTDLVLYEVAGGNRLLQKRLRAGKIPAGEAGFVPARRLRAKYMIHASGPRWEGGGNGERELLRSCYDKSLTLARDLRCRSVAVPLLTAGPRGFPGEEALAIAASALSRFLLQYEIKIILVVPDEEPFFAPGELFSELRRFVDGNYVPEAERAGHAPEILRKEGDDYKPKTLQAGYGGYDPEAPRKEHASVFDASPAPDGKRPSGGSAAFSEKAGQGRTGSLFSGTTAQRRGMPAPARAENLRGKPLPQGQSAPPLRDSARAQGPKQAQRQMLSHCELEDYIGRAGVPFSEHLQGLINKKGMSNVDVYKKANMDKKYFSKLINGRVNPSKTKVLSLAVALKLNLDETIDFLRYAGFALSPANKTDLIFEYYIRRGEYDIFTIDIALFDYGLPSLSD